MPKVATKTRIIQTALEMFNEERFGAVTTAALAKRLEMAEGNLWYHFPAKRDLLKAITELFIPHVQGRLGIRPTPDGDVLDQYALMLYTFNKEQRDFRFMYRDQADYGEHTGKLLSHLPKFFADTFEQFDEFHNALIEQGFLRRDEQRIADYAEASIISFRYFLEYSRERGISPKAKSAIYGASDLHLRLFAPLFQEDALAQIRTHLNGYQRRGAR